MEITIVTNAPPTSGVGKPALELVEVLRTRGHLVHVLHLDASQGAVRLDDRVLWRARMTPKRWKPLFWLAAGMRSPLPSTGIIHFANQTLAFLAARARGRSVVTVWDLLELSEPVVRSGRLTARVLYRGIPRAEAIIVPSQATAKAVMSTYLIPADRITVIPQALPKRFQYQHDLAASERVRAFLRVHALDPARPIILYVGSEHPRKNLLRLLEAVSRVRTIVPDVQVVKVGSAGTARGRKAFWHTANRLGLSSCLTMVEESRDEDLLLWYHAATVFVFPSLAEGFGFPPLEALACGTPVVTSNCSSLPEVVGDAALLVDPLDPQAITDALVRVITDQRLRATLRARGLVRARMFTLESTAAATERVYQRVADQR